MTESEHFQRLGITMETMLQLWRDGNADAATAIWQGLDGEDQLNVVAGLAAIVNHVRMERDGPPDPTSGPRV